MQKTLPPVTEMQRAFQSKDPSYDGIFFTGVHTTGIFCRPSCSARKPLPENTSFFRTVKEAMFAGFRPCLRCRPLETDGRPPDWVQGVLAAVDASRAARVKDSEIRELGLDPARVRRYFLKHYGMTFQAYCRARRMGKALDEIRQGRDLDDVGFDHGYESNSGFRYAFMETFGKTPGHSRNADCIVVSWIETPVGPMIAGANSDSVCLLEFTDRRMLEAQLRTLAQRFERPLVPGINPWIDQLKQELAAYFKGALQQFRVPLSYPGSLFQQKVWDELLRIPFGQTRSYEDIARSIGSPGAVRAVGHANGLNRIAIVVPCHRVVNKGGKLGGYGGGLWRKQYLLDLEREAIGATRQLAL